MVTVKRIAGGVETELTSCRLSKNERARCELCRRAYMKFGRRDDDYELRCYDTPHSGPFGDVFERDDWRQIEPWDCDSCEEYDPRGLRFPLTVGDILVEQPEIKKPLGHKIGSVVVVRPCEPRFEGKTYLGMLAGETTVLIGLQYDESEKELIVYGQMSNPLIVIPELSTTVHGYESWWRVATEEDLVDLSEITDEEILSQPYMVALAKAQAEM